MFTLNLMQSHPLALKCYANRAACYKQLSNFEGTISDSTMVLEYKPDDIKVTYTCNKTTAFGQIKMLQRPCIHKFPLATPYILHYFGFDMMYCSR